MVDLAEPLSDADATIQSMPDASPAKWHLAHTTWFWETFLLRDHAPGYAPYDARWPFLHNSYYEAEGERVARAARGMLSRPSLREIFDYREAVTAAMAPLFERPELSALIKLGIAHEQQHIELMLTDIKHAMFQNPLFPAIWPAEGERANTASLALDWHEIPGGIAEVGAHSGAERTEFSFDNEGPRHRVMMEPFALANRLVTNAEWGAFVADGGYQAAEFWLSDGWAWVQEHGITAPLYWNGDDHFTYQGMQPRGAHAPVTHISYYEADAFAAWYSQQTSERIRLPTEFEWEVAAEHLGSDPAGGVQLDRAAPPLLKGTSEMFGDAWQFTRSAYLPYPRFTPASGAVGEYNGKFMSGQFVLKGASCATVRAHSRASYRNFFYPHQRWQFTGLRLAKDLG